MKFLLDTDTVSHALRGEGEVEKRLLDEKPSAVGVSAITVAELRFGAHKRGSQKLHRAIETFLRSVKEYPFDSRAAQSYGEIAAQLRSTGQPIGVFDTLIAAHALALEVTLVTHNTRHFRQVPELAVVDWY